MNSREWELIMALTPVVKTETVLAKRDDLFAPFRVGRVNGGKLRQALYMMLTGEVKGVVTGGAINSPQAPIVATVAQYMKIPCIVMYGGTTEARLDNSMMATIVRTTGAQIQIMKCARHPALFGEARKMAKELGWLCVEYGMNSQDPTMREAFYETTANQVQNLPDIKTLVVTCGSGITSAGILYGIHKYKKHVGNVVLVGTAPNRQKVVAERLAALGVTETPPIEYVDLYAQPGFSYDKRAEAHLVLGDRVLALHPNYEAKTYRWLAEHIPARDFDRTLLWIVGSEPYW